MPYLVNGQLVSEDRVRIEEARLMRDAQWRAIADEVERARRLRTAAHDPRPVHPDAIERALQTQRAMGLS